MLSAQGNLNGFHEGDGEMDGKRYSDHTDDSEMVEFSREESENQERQNTEQMSLIRLMIASHAVCEQPIHDQNKKAVNWLITLSWTQNYSLETLWNSIGYYYAYVSTKPVEKGKLTVLLLTLVNLSLKLFEVQKVLNFGEMQKMLGKDLHKRIFIDMESQILELFGFDLFFENNLTKIFNFAEFEEEKYRVLFLCEMLFLNNFESAISKTALKELFQLANDPKVDNQAKAEIIKLSKLQKQSKIIKQKYSSQIDVDQFLEEITK